MNEPIIMEINLSSNQILKKCSKCKEEKLLSFFGLCKNKPRQECKDCRHLYYISKKKYICDKSRKYHNDNKKIISIRVKKYREKNIEKIIEQNKLYYQNNKEDILEKQRDYYILNKEKRIKYQTQYKKQRKKNDIVFKMKENISKAVWEGLKKQKSSKKSPTWKILPYTPQQLKEHLENQFEDWMTWENYGQASIINKTWNIEHIIPKSLLPYDSMEHPNFLKCWCLENLRPYDAIENIKKGNKII